MPSQVENVEFCECGRKKIDCYEELCSVCSQCSVVLQCASEQKLVPEVEAVILPVTCSVCGLRFPDRPYHDDHVKTAHSTTAIDLSHANVNSLNVAQLKSELKK